jgi:hypothetical protein
VVFYWLADDPQASLAALASSPEPFDAWLRAAAGRAHPLPLATIATIAAGHTLIAQYPPRARRPVSGARRQMRLTKDASAQAAMITPSVDVQPVSISRSLRL